MNFKNHAKLSIALHLLAAVLVTSCLFQTFFKVQVESSQEFHLKIASLKFEFPLGKSHSMPFYADFKDVSNLCAVSDSLIFNALCPDAASFSSAGLLFATLSGLVLTCSLITAGRVYLILFRSLKPRYEYCCFLSVLVYFIAICSYLIIFSSFSADFKESSGIAYSILIEIYLILITYHYYFAVFAEVPNQLFLQNEVEMKDNILVVSTTPLQANPPAFDTIQSEKEFIEKGLKPNRQKSDQIEGLFMDPEVENMKRELSRLKTEKNELEIKLSFLVGSKNEGNPSLAKATEKEVRILKEKQEETEKALNEAKKEIKKYKKINETLQETNKELSSNLNTQERLILELRNNFKSFDDLSEGKRENFSSHERLTDSTRWGSIPPGDRDSWVERVVSLSKALELQKEINEQLNSRNKQLEETTKRLSDLSDLASSKPVQSEEPYKKLEKKLMKIRTKHQGCGGLIDSQLSRIQELQEECENLSFKTERVKDKSKEFENLYLDTSSQFIREKNEWFSEKEDLKYSNNLLQREIDSLKTRLRLQEDSLNQEIQALTSEIDRLKDKISLYQAEKSEIEGLRDSHSPLSLDKNRETTPDWIKISPSKTDPKNEVITTDLDRSFHSLLSEKEDLRKTLAEKESALKELAELNSKLNQQLFLIQEQPRVSLESREVTAGSFVSEASSYTSGLSVQEMMIIENLGGIDFRTNPLMEKVAKLKKEPPMIYTNLWKLMEKLMREKMKVDKMDLALKRKPRLLSEFINDFMLSHFGLQALANRQLKALTASLEDLYRLNHPYGVFLARLLGLFHPRPISAELGCYLMVVQSMFNEVCIDNLQSFAENYDVLQYGGRASIVDLMEIVMKLCKNNRKTGERIISSIHKENDRKLEISLVKACGTLAKTNSDARSVFELLDNNNSSNLDYHEFCDGIRYTLGIWVTQDEAEEICGFIDEDGNGTVTAQEWVGKINFEVYRKKIFEPSACVSKVQFLNAFIEEHELEMVEDYNTLRQRMEFRSYSKEKFVKFVKGIDREVKDYNLAKIFEKLKNDERSENVSAEGICLEIMKHRIGGFGVGIFGLDKLGEIN